MQGDNRTAHNDPSHFILVVVVGADFDDVAPAAILLGLAGRQSAISPTRFPAVTPSRRARATIVGSVLVSAAALPIVIAFVAISVGVRVTLAFSFSFRTIRQSSRR